VAIIRLQHIGIAVRDLDVACQKLESLFGLKARDFRDNQGKGMQRDARILLGNQCWLHLVQNWDTESRVFKFLERVKAAGVEVFQKRIFDATDGFEAFIYPEDTAGFTVELIQPHADSWGYPDDPEAG
jgi:catechol 2,3-dioxygenase-like lactoylglutathione lyase family enzyme